MVGLAQHLLRQTGQVEGAASLLKGETPSDTQAPPLSFLALPLLTGNGTSES